MKEYALIFILLITLCLTGCSIEIKEQPQEHPHLYWKDTEAVITKIDKKHWFATTHHWEIDMTVEIEEYNLTKRFTIIDTGAWNCPDEWELEKGDTIEVILYSWKMDSTGKIVKREIHKIN